MPTLGKLDIEVISRVKEERKKCATKHYLQEVVPKNHERFQRLCSSVGEINKCQEELETLKWWFRVMDMHEETIRENTGTSEIEKM